jgi:hypothetical protein
MQKTEVAESRFWILADQLFRFLCSLKIAVIIILTLAVALATATVLESLYDTATAQYWVYHARWFELNLVMLGVNIFCVAMSRIPWKLKHTPFLLAHLGIILLLIGSWVTQRKGIDGNLRVTEGDAESVVELDQSLLVVVDQDRVSSMTIPWIPSGVKFSPISTSGRNFPTNLTVDQWVTHADPEVKFIPRPVEEPRQNLGALRLLVTGGPMRISQDIWLWEGAPQWKEVQAGPARFFLSRRKIEDDGKPGPWLGVEIQEGRLGYVAKSSDGKFIRGFLSQKEGLTGKVIRPGWKGDVTLTVQEWIADSKINVEYRPARIQYGPQAPSSAIRVVGSQGESVWLGLGERAVLHSGQKEVSVGYFPRRVVLPFAVRLDRFEVEHDPGTNRPAAYSSQVTVVGAGEDRKATISMNEPLDMKGYSIYQASYEDAQPRPVTSIFSVNQDPGRGLKYIGSLLIVFGSILLSAEKYRKKSNAKAGAASKVNAGLSDVSAEVGV